MMMHLSKVQSVSYRSYHKGSSYYGQLDREQAWILYLTNADNNFLRFLLNEEKFDLNSSIFNGNLMMAACQGSPNVSWWAGHEDNSTDVESHPYDRQSSSSGLDPMLFQP